MKRKSILYGGLFLALVYALVLVAFLALGIASVVYFFMGDSVQVISDIFLPILKPFLVSGNTLMLVYVWGMVILSIYFLIASTRFIKYSSAQKDVFFSKKTLMVIYLVSFIIGLGIFCFILINNLTDFLFGENLILNIISALAIFVHAVCCVMLMVGIASEKEVLSEVQETQLNPLANTKQPAIYTSGLDDEVVEEKEEQPQKIETKKVELKESATTKKLIDSIGKLDQMRKDGSISAKEYTKLRAQMIKKYTN